MKVVKSYPDGLFCWIDLLTTDIEGAKAFYQGMFGWQYVDLPTDVGPTYTMCQIEGYNICGMSQMSPDMEAQGIPPSWSSYIKHDNVDLIAASLLEAGGTLEMPPTDVMESGRMLMAVDPTGAAFGVWQPKSHIGAQLVNMPNTLIWNELQTRQIEDAKSFYVSVFGWDTSVNQDGYVTFKTGDRDLCGMIRIDDSWGPIPANWAVYFMVEDVLAADDKAVKLGAKVLVPPTPVGEMGKFSAVQDPQGGIFTIMHFNRPVDDPPGYE